MSSDATETYLIPLEGWRQAQQSPAKSVKIRQVVVE